MAQMVKDIIPRILDDSRDWRLSLMQKWDTIVGSLQTRVCLEKVVDDLVIIGVYESQWMQELYLLSDVLVQTINDALPEPRIKKIKFKLVEKKQRIVSQAIPMTKVVSVPRVLTSLQKNALQDVTDPELRKFLVSFWQRCG